MLRIGAHVSIADGFAGAVDHETELGGTCGQIFVGSPRGWAVNDVDESDAETFRESATEQDVGPWIVHGTYLINFATPKDDLGAKSIDCVQDELEATAALGIPYYVFHPGAHTGAGEETGIANVGERLSEVEIPQGVTLLLENTAGKGTTVGTLLSDLDEMVSSSRYDYDDVGICLDTCHLFAAGYDFRDDETMDDLIEEIDATVGLDNVHYLHLNDSKHPFGSEKDEHEHIGEGEIGDEGFRRFVTHDALREKPMVLETPEDEKGYAWNIDKIRDLYGDD